MTMMTSVIAFEPRAGQPLLRRPRLLVQAARAGLAGWNRDRDLKRVLKCENVPKPGAAMTAGLWIAAISTILLMVASVALSLQE